MGRKWQVRTIQAKIANRRVDRARKITIGDVSASAMARTRMAKTVLDAGWSTLRGMLR
ncbi:hypothetical protein ACQKQD_32420 [Methylobacterium sp. NPDC080182]|uniref:hypothetical protein n=1 Tax=Methylobacterium sp. NPDC080182 TaxID=3390590 RepID=UPI003D0436A6